MSSMLELSFTDVATKIFACSDSETGFNLICPRRGLRRSRMAEKVQTCLNTRMAAKHKERQSQPPQARKQKSRCCALAAHSTGIRIIHPTKEGHRHHNTVTALPSRDYDERITKMTNKLTAHSQFFEALLFLLARMDQPADQVITAWFAGHPAEVRA